MSAVTAHKPIGPDQVGEGSVLSHDGAERGALAIQTGTLVFQVACMIGHVTI